MCVCVCVCVGGKKRGKRKEKKEQKNANANRLRDIDLRLFFCFLYLLFLPGTFFSSYLHRRNHYTRQKLQETDGIFCPIKYVAPSCTHGESRLTQFLRGVKKRKKKKHITNLKQAVAASTSCPSAGPLKNPGYLSKYNISICHLKPIIPEIIQMSHPPKI